MPGGRRFSDLLIVDREFTTRGRTIAEFDILAFAGLSGDFNPVHLDETHARRTSFGTRIVHGPLVMAAATGLIGLLGRSDEWDLELQGFEEWQFVRAVAPGTTVRVRFRVIDRARGEVTVIKVRAEVVDQQDDVVQRGIILYRVMTEPLPVSGLA